MAKANRFSSRLWSVVMTLICVLWMYPIFMALMISLKQPSAISTATAFELPNADTFAGFVNYENAINQQGFFSSLFYSVLITVTSVFAILIFCSMFAWYITRVHTRFTKLLYGLCAFSMVVPFQMVMFTLSSMADTLHLRTPWTLWIIYLGFGAGLAVFMFAGFMKTVPLEIEEAAMIQNIPWIKRMIHIIIPIQKTSIISGYLLPFMTCLRELSLFILLCTQGFILSTTLDYFDEMGLYAFSSGINLILIVTILICNAIVNKVTGASLDKGIGG